jgi:acetolactate synthase-1/2/3 large subunit
MAKAIRTALAPPRGPVLVDIPWDVLTERFVLPEAETTPVHHAGHGTAAPRAAVDQILDLLDRAHRPVLLAARRSRDPGPASSCASSPSAPASRCWRTTKGSAPSPAAHWASACSSHFTDSRREESQTW